MIDGILDRRLRSLEVLIQELNVVVTTVHIAQLSLNEKATAKGAKLITMDISNAFIVIKALECYKDFLQEGLALASRKDELYDAVEKDVLKCERLLRDLRKMGNWRSPE